MKKVLALLLALVMVFALCACGDSTAPAADPTEAPAEATPEATEAHVVSEETAAQDVRPNTMIVAVDENLTVSTLDGEVLSENLAEYLASVKPTTLPALYIRDDATAAAVNAFAAEYSLADTFVVADYEHTQYVKDICDANVSVLGIIDWREAKLSTERRENTVINYDPEEDHKKPAAASAAAGFLIIIAFTERAPRPDRSADGTSRRRRRCACSWGCSPTASRACRRP